MKKLLFLWLLFPFISFAQTTTVSVTVVDSTGQVWSNGTISYQFKRNPIFNNTPLYNGAPIANSLLTPTLVPLDNTGSATIVVPTSTSIFPAGSSWTYTVCPNASTQVCNSVDIPAIGNTQNISSTVTAAITPISISVTPIPIAYNDNQIKLTPAQSGFYFNSVSKTPKFWDGSAWQQLSTSSNPGITGPQQALFGATQSPSGGIAGIGPTSITTDSATHTQLNNISALSAQTLLQTLPSQQGNTNDASFEQFAAACGESFFIVGIGTSHDDSCEINKAAIYSGANNVKIRLRPTAVYYFASTIHMQSHMHFEGNSGEIAVMQSGVNGDAFDLAPGAIQGVTLANILLTGNPALPNSRGIHLNASAISGSNPLQGGFWDSKISNTEIDGFALECIWSDAGGGPGYNGLLPNQFFTLEHFNCNGPNQLHNTGYNNTLGPSGAYDPSQDHSSLVHFTGVQAQISVRDGQTNAQSSIFYPGPTVVLQPKTPNLNDAPVNVHFYNYTIQGGTTGILDNFASNVGFDYGYMEQVPKPMVAQNASGLSFSYNQMNDSGFNGNSVVTVLGGTGISVDRNSIAYNSAYGPPAHLVSCSTSNTNTVSVTGGTTDANLDTTGCFTSQTGANTGNAITFSAQTPGTGYTGNPICMITDSVATDVIVPARCTAAISGSGVVGTLVDGGVYTSISHITIVLSSTNPGSGASITLGVGSAVTAFAVIGDSSLLSPPPTTGGLPTPITRFFSSQPGAKTLTVRAFGGPLRFQNDNSGNIDFATFPPDFLLAQDSYITFEKLDLGSTWTIRSSTGISPITVASAALTPGIPVGSICTTDLPLYAGSPNYYSHSRFCNTGSSTAIYQQNPTPVGYTMNNYILLISWDSSSNATIPGILKANSLATTQTAAASTTASDHSVPININGTTYYVRLSATP